jgi:NAD(P)-dependent dehydrogenase (short-subunit alcohol dehydrogenase family)
MSTPTSPLILVTGGNRGIGLEICRQLAQRGAQVILTARAAATGRKAADALAAEGLRVEFQPLDVTGEASLELLRRHVAEHYGRLDGLINNAGVFLDVDALSADLATLRQTLETNTLAPLRLAQVFAPLLRQASPGRIINISSGLGQLHDMEGGQAGYRISKTALNAVTRILAAELAGTVVVNAMCPGWVRTDMGGPNAPRDVAQGADTAVWLALDAPANVTGGFFRDRQAIAW